MKRLLFLVFAVFAAIITNAQSITVKGRIVEDTAKKAVPNANVELTQGTAVKRGAVTDNKGSFLIQNVEPGKYILKISRINYKSFQKNIEVTNTDIDLSDITVVREAKSLSEVVVTAKTPPSQQKNDTTEFNSKAFKVNPDATAEDLIQKMPTITVQNGQVQAQGENVQKVLVDGKPFFGDDATSALRNLPAEIIDKIQVYDQKSDQAQFTGFDDGNQYKTLNIVTKSNRRAGQFGKVFGGYGTDNHYTVGGNVNIFNGDSRISIIGQSNNVNQQNFSTEDLLGVTGGGGGGRGRGGFGGGGGGGRGPGGSNNNIGNFQVGQQSGISKTNAFGINYTDNWGKKINVSGSYFFNRSDNDLLQNTDRTNLLKDSGRTHYLEDLASKTMNVNHRFNFLFEYKIDSFNSLQIRPRLSYQINNGNSLTNGSTDTITGLPVNRSTNLANSDLNGYNFSNNILFRHSFRKKGRTFSLNINNGFTQNDGNGKLLAETDYYNSLGNPTDTTLTNQISKSNANGWTMAINGTYTEPIGKYSQLMGSYQWTDQQSKSDKETFLYNANQKEYNELDTTQTNKFKSDYITQQAGLGYNYQKQKINLMVRGAFQWADLNNEQFFPKPFNLKKDFNSFLPMALFQYRVSQHENLRINYRTNTNNPSISQLQNVLDKSNPLQMSTGNPNLKQTYQQTLNIRYNKSNTQKGTSMFAFINGSFSDNYITNNTITAVRDSVLLTGDTLHKGSQFIYPVNINGYWNSRAFVTFGFPVGFLKSNLNLNATAGYTNAPGLVNSVENVAKTQNYSVGIVLASNISEKVDFTISSNSGYNITKNTAQSYANNNYFSQATSLRFNWIFGKNFVYNTDITHTYYNGISGNPNYFLWNMAVGKKFLKDNRGDLRLSVYDILKQNQSITRTVDPSYYQDVKTNVLQRYFMLTFTYTLRNFKTKGTTIPENQYNEQRPPGMRMGMPPGGAGPPPGDGGGPPMF
ncbi:TonB-dependent receptor [Pinibacter soli]|uniref:TonB-dependent receptor n=1 Tax=Pinibacter soli TaxID=3044211 RepID=A0ABT6R7V6_9BACT|nr:TonB-dependent receptor [Pinibacter soli]MDI3318480.1 TonB-dependent receptor [Pinibacter soli]